MKVILFKLDAPGNKYDWFVKDIEIHILADIEKLMGYCANHIYAELYQVDEDDDPAVVKEVKRCLLTWYPETAKDTIMRLFKLIKRAVEIQNKQRNKRSL